MFEEPLRRIVSEHGVFLRREANAFGFDDKAVQRAYRAGAWIRVHHGAYTFKDIWDRSDEIDRHKIRSRAVLRTHSPGVVLSHVSSIAEHGLDVWGIDLSKTHVTRTDGASGRCTSRVVHHEGRCGPDDLEEITGVPVTALARAVMETAAVTSVESGLVLADSALHRKLVTPDDLRRSYLDLRDWPGARRADLVLRLSDERAESVGESRSRFLMWSQGVPLPELQYEVRDAHGHLIGTTDFAWPRSGLLGEFDGRVKYGRLLRPGEDASDVVVREKRREERLCERTGWRMIRLAWPDLYTAAATAHRIQRMLRLAA